MYDHYWRESHHEILLYKTENKLAQNIKYDKKS